MEASTSTRQCLSKKRSASLSFSSEIQNMPVDDLVNEKKMESAEMMFNIAEYVFGLDIDTNANNTEMESDVVV